MKVLVDTNVYVSAFAFDSRTFYQLIRFLYMHHEIAVSDYLAQEILRVVGRLNPERVPNALDFLRLPDLLLIEQTTSRESGFSVRDHSDQQILDAAVAGNVDIILTGDKDFHALEIDRPRIMTPAQFIGEFMRG